MASLINPSQNLLYVAGNLIVEDNLTIYKNTIINEDLTVSGLSTLPTINSGNITNEGGIITNRLLVNQLSRFEGDTTINGVLTVNGVDTQSIGTLGNIIEFYYGDQMIVNTLTVNNEADIANLTVDVFEANTATINTEFISLGTSEVQDLTVNDTLDVTGPATFASAVTLDAEFEMLDKEYKKDFFDEPVANTIYVKTDGDDARSGRDPINALKTIERAADLARELRREVEDPILISVYPGVYVEDGEIALPDRTGLYSIGGQYVTELHMSDLGRKEYRNMILMDSGCYCQGFSFRNMEVDDLDNPSGGFAYAFAPGAIIKRSPYCRDSSQLSNETYLKPAPPLDPATGNPAVGKGGGMVLADRSVVSAGSTYPYMLCFGATPRSNNGLGYVAKNGAGINGISSMTIYQRTAFYALNGGQLTLNNSGTQFGDISLRSSGNTTVVSPYTVSSTDVLVANAQIGNAILSNAEVLTDLVWQDLVDNGPDRYGNVNTDPNFVPWTNGFEYDVATCQRDVGYILNAVKQDLLMRTNYNTITAGMSYLRNIAGIAYVNSTQYNQTLNAIEYAKDETIKITSPGNKTAVKKLFNNVTKKIRNKDTNHEYIFETPGVPLYNEEKCYRDVGLIIKGVMLDSILGTNYNTVTAGLSYVRVAANKAITDQLVWTVAAIEFARDTAIAIPGLDPVTTSLISAGFDEVLDILQNGEVNANPLSFPNAYASLGSTGDHVTASTVLQNNRASLSSQVIGYISTNYPDLEYDQAKCERDVGYIIDGLTHDILYGGTYATITVAQSYFVDTDGPINPGVEGQLGEGESTATLAAYEAAKSIFNSVVVTTAEQNRVEDLMDTIIYAIKKGTNAYIPEPIEPTSTIGGAVQADYTTVLVKRNQIQAQTIEFINSDLFAILGYAPTTNADDAKNQLLLNKEFILTKAIDFVTSNYPMLSYDTASCRRDAGYILDGIVHDVLYGGNFATIGVARSYYTYGDLVVPIAEKAATIAAWNDMSAVMQNVIQGLEAGQETYPYTLATATEASVIANLMTVITGYIDNPIGNPLPAEVLPNTTWVDTVTVTDSVNIASNVSTIQTNTTDWLDATYSNYFENICKKDDKIIIESIGLDIVSGKEMTTQAAAQAYYDYKGGLVVPAEQIPAFQHVWAKIKQLLQNEAGGPGTDVGIMIGELVDAFENTVTNPITVTFGSLVESLAHQFNNAGAGVNTNALPLNFNKPGFNRPVPFSILQENGGRVRWSGADEINNQYFAGGTKINGQTGKFEGRPFNISVRAIARRLANSRGGF